MTWHPSLYPNAVRLFGYSSRNQPSADDYVNLLSMRMNAKHGKLSKEFLDPLNLTNDDLKVGLKLPLNAYTGTLRATFNKLYDPLQGFSICTTGQLLILQLIHNLQQLPTLKMVSANTDAVMFTIEEEHKPQALKVLKDWEELTGFELEEDKIVKICMRDVNNYCEILQVGDNDYKVNYKGGEFKGNHKFKWNKEEKKFHYSFDDEIEANSMTIISEALLKNLLFNIPIEETILTCNDIFRFQIISHLGRTYEKIVQESSNGDIDLPNRNNRVYAGKIPSGLLVKIKWDNKKGRWQRDTLSLCPENPIIDNDNRLTINDINKEWYVKLAKQKLDKFKGVKRLNEYKKIELVEMAKDMGLKFDTKIKKVDLIKLIEEYKEGEINMTKKETVAEKNIDIKSMNIYEKINAMKEDVKKVEFVMDQVQAGQLGGKEYPSIGQYYRVITDVSIKYHLLFTWEVMNIDSMEKDMFKPTGKMPQHVTTVCCKAQFFDIDHFKVDDEGGNMTPYIEYYAYASGSDSCDKGTSAASSMAFRNWFDKNFAPSYLTIDEFDGESEVGEATEKTEEPKVPTYIPQERKEEITKEVVQEVQKEDNNSDDVKKVIDNIMKVRELLGNENWGASTLDKLINGEITSVDLMEIELKVNNKLETLEG